MADIDAPERVDFTDQATQFCPWQAYRYAREAGPVYYEESTGFYVVLRYDLVRRIAIDTGRFANETGVMKPFEGEALRILQTEGVPYVTGLVLGDGEAHEFQRALVQNVFSVPRVKKMENYFVELIDGHIDEFIDRGWCDYHKELSVLVPMTVISDQLGLERKDLGFFARLSDADAECAQPNLSPERLIEIARTIAEGRRYLAVLAEKYRDNPADCLMSDIVNGEVDGRRPTLAEIVTIANIMITAGNESTTNAMDAAMLMLVETAGLEDRLRNDHEQIPNFVEEILRYDAPFQALFRRAIDDVEIEGVHIPAGSIVELRWGAANRDPKQFESPDEFDPSRRNARRHVTFGLGAHSCVGSNLSRAELRVLTERLLARMKNFRLKGGRDESVQRQPHYFVRGVQSLQIEFERV